MWEALELRRQESFAKTVFVMPPETRFDGKIYSELWSRAQASLRDHGIFLPSHHRRGLQFSLYPHGMLLDHAAFSQDGRLAIASALSMSGNGQEDWCDSDADNDGEWDDDSDNDGGSADNGGGFGDGGGE